MNVLSLFDGLSGAMLALQQAGIKVDNYFTSEIDKHSESVSKRHFPDIVRLGDITKIHGGYLPKIDLVIGGSPCQGFSLAGRRLNFDDPRSKLFFDYVRLVEILNPKYFIMENVPMNKKVSQAISERLGVDYTKINSALITAQNRNRLYWTNFEINQPKDLGILLRNIIEDGVVDRDKSYCIDSSYYKGTSSNIYFNKKRRQAVFKNNSLMKSVKLGYYGKGGQGQRVYSVNGKSVAIRALGGGQGAKTGLYVVPSTTVQGDWVIRKLTPIECERLQGLSDDFTKFDEDGKIIADTNRYKMIGNGFTVPIIAHILGEMGDCECSNKLLIQMDVI